MDTPYRITAELHTAERAVTLRLNGKFSEDALSELDLSIAAAKRSHHKVYVDLSEVTLVDRKAVQYFSLQDGIQVKVVNCPSYLQRWISQEVVDAER